MIQNVDNLMVELETAELDLADGFATSQIYSQLLAVYLLKNDLCQAKYLWKRIPAAVKNNCSDLHNIWTVAQKMWQRDWQGTHAALNFEWNMGVSEIMNALKERIRERAIALVENAYSSLDITTFSNMTGLSVTEAREILQEKGWNITGTTVRPVKVEKEEPSIHETITEEQLNKLTQFVSFLEN